ncbi:double-strand break repair protein AddB [Thalassobius sp. S69A]|uniref:double-strand break repair protein AddB n=1 Tax=unclassified Thalassovita TaxID=2619711 RepID=UPI000C107802|nr:double-strand break repair protein AddB [Paracoccaceae bacterium]MBT26570.1 double-strand break repair protein AddB [Paracoccaceae bacterium]
MFEPSDKPRIYGVPLGVDFPKELARGVQDRMRLRQQSDLARVQLVLNTRRMQRRVRELFDTGPATLLPRLQMVTDISLAAAFADIPPAVSSLRRRLEITQLVSILLEREPDLAPRSSLFDLADSLAALLEEMHGEGVSPDAIQNLDVADESGHWKRSLSFLSIVQHYFDDVHEAPDKESQQRLVIQALTQLWNDIPPQNPIVIAGSTGSRGTTMTLMKAIAKLPQGAIVLPGFDFDMPLSAWEDLKDPLTSEDHPQFRFRKLMDAVGIAPQDVQPWTDAVPSCPERTKLISLALRPAPVTDRWLSEGPHLPALPAAMQNVTLVEATSQRDEALAIAMRLRQACEDGVTAALITPDRMLTRQVSAALSRWKITPDDSAGTPLQLSPPGRFLRHVSALFHQKLTAESLLTLLFHPLTHSGGGRGPHLRLSRELELFIRRKGIPFPDADNLQAFAASRKEAQDWVAWIIRCFVDQQRETRSLSDWLTDHLALAEMIANGAAAEQTSELWKEDAGRAALSAITDLKQEAEAGGDLAARDYADLFGAILARQEVRNPDAPHPNVLIWGTLEARVQGADLLILAGLNEGSWPESPSPDPWLNRQMRLKSGLLLPERRIGLSAHDFQQAVAAPEVWLTRAIRSDDAQTVPSRWLNRMTNLLQGLPDQDGPAALENAKARGNEWLALAQKMEEPGFTPPAPRPSPMPPMTARPRELSVTDVSKLIRDPYHIYAKRVLRLRPLDPLMKVPDALLRGTVVHSVFEVFLKQVRQDSGALSAEKLNQIAADVLAQTVPWPEIRSLWSARVARVADWFVEHEKSRQQETHPAQLEISGKASIPQLGFTLSAKADRIDLDALGRAYLYDYKTSNPPMPAQQKAFDKQLLLEAAMVERGGFDPLGPQKVARATYIGLGATPKEVDAPLGDEPPEVVWAKFEQLISAYLEPDSGFTARRAMFKDQDISDYDPLSRFGEWDLTVPPSKEDLSDAQ